MASAFTSRILIAIGSLTLCVHTLHAELPTFKIRDGGVHIEGVSRKNPIIYDNDWWFDVFDNNYLWAQASLGRIDLRGNVVSRDMWDWEHGYLYPMQQCIDDGGKRVASGTRHC